MGSRPTVVEVARRAGVSIASVSRVLNGKSSRPETGGARARPPLPSSATFRTPPGRALKLGSTLQVAFAVDDVANPVYTEMMKGVEGPAWLGSGSRLMVASTGHDLADLISVVKGLSRGYADALVISPLRTSPELVEALLAAPVPVVVVGNVGDTVSLDTVRTDSGQGVQIAYRHLVETGRRRIAFVNGPIDTAPGRARQEGFAAACRDHNGAGACSRGGRLHRRRR